LNSHHSLMVREPRRGSGCALAGVVVGFWRVGVSVFITRFLTRLIRQRAPEGLEGMVKGADAAKDSVANPPPSPSPANATPAMTDDTILPFSFPAVHTKKVTAAFDGGRLTSNGGVMLLAMAERRLGLADNLARVFPDRRDPTRVVHSLVDMFRARMFAICCGYEDADDLDHLRSDPAFKLACGRLPDTGRDLCSQPTLSRLENA